MKAAIAIACHDLPAQAFEIDYDALFDLHADTVQQATPTRRILELPGPVIITDYDGMYTATDQSPMGASGCAVDRVFQIAAAVQMCPETLGEMDRALLTRLVVNAATYLANNTYPPIALETLPSYLEGALASRAAAMDPQLCDDPDAPWTGFAAYLASEAGFNRMSQPLKRRACRSCTPAP